MSDFSDRTFINSGSKGLNAMMYNFFFYILLWLNVIMSVIS